MPSLKLESFSHDIEIRKGISKFQSFEALRDSAYNDGIKSGAEAASKAYEAEKIRSLAPILEALNDMAFTQVEAQHAALSSLRPVLVQLVESVLPEAAHKGFADTIANLVCRAYSKAPQAKIIIHVAPDAVISIRSLLKATKADHTVVPDSNLTPLQAKVAWQDGFDQIDQGQTFAQIRSMIDEFFNNIEKTGSENV